MQTEGECGERILASTQPRTATKEDMLRIKGFLRENGLPDLGVDECVENFVIAENESGNWIGVAGVEFYGENGLLRSVAVAKQSRALGYGRILVNTILGNARDKGIKTIYLLTQDADNYFQRLGFQIVDRMNVDGAVKRSLEFTEACPECATVMRKTID
jgi:N-acetylglutamate synthase-like GNAT family acetyltransferase